jgi:hypothetical protein
LPTRSNPSTRLLSWSVCTLAVHVTSQGPRANALQADPRRSGADTSSPISPSCASHSMHTLSYDAIYRICKHAKHCRPDNRGSRARKRLEQTSCEPARIRLCLEWAVDKMQVLPAITLFLLVVCNSLWMGITLLSRLNFSASRFDTIRSAWRKSGFIRVRC